MWPGSCPGQLSPTCGLSPAGCSDPPAPPRHTRPRSSHRRREDGGVCGTVKCPYKEVAWVTSNHVSLANARHWPHPASWEAGNSEALTCPEQGLDIGQALCTRTLIEEEIQGSKKLGRLQPCSTGVWRGRPAVGSRTGRVSGRVEAQGGPRCLEEKKVLALETGGPQKGGRGAHSRHQVFMVKHRDTGLQTPGADGPLIRRRQSHQALTSSDGAEVPEEGSCLSWKRRETGVVGRNRAGTRSWTGQRLVETDRGFRRLFRFQVKEGPCASGGWRGDCLREEVVGRSPGIPAGSACL